MESSRLSMKPSEIFFLRLTGFGSAQMLLLCYFYFLFLIKYKLFLAKTNKQTK